MVGTTARGAGPGLRNARRRSPRAYSTSLSALLYRRSAASSSVRRLNSFAPLDARGWLRNRASNTAACVLPSICRASDTWACCAPPLCGNHLAASCSACLMRALAAFEREASGKCTAGPPSPDAGCPDFSAVARRRTGDLLLSAMVPGKTRSRRAPLELMCQSTRLGERLPKAAQRLEPFAERGVGVDLHRHADVAVAGDLPDDVRGHAEVEQQGDAGVAEVVGAP